MLLAGRYDLIVDNKNRLSIPATVRAGMDPEQDGTAFYLVPGKHDGTLRLYADRYFQRYAEQCDRMLKPGPRKDEFELLFYAMASLMELDKQGRVILPQWLLDKAVIGRQVCLTGSRDHLVLWNREACKTYLDRNWNRHADLFELARDNGQPERPAGAEGQTYGTTL